MRRFSPFVLPLALSLACAIDGEPDDLETRDADLVVDEDQTEAPVTPAGPSSVTAESETTEAIFPFPIGPNCNGIPVGKCDATPGCTVDAIGCDPPLCEIDPYSGEEVCYPCDPVLVCVAENVQCFGLSIPQCLNYPDDCEILVGGCDNVPLCPIGPFGGMEPCFGCDPFAICVDKQPSPVGLPLP